MTNDYGKLEKYLEDSKVIEILCNADGRIWVDKVGSGMERTEDVLGIGQRDILLRVIASRNGKSITAMSPTFGGKVKEYNARIQGEVPPVVEAPIFTIRKPTKHVLSLSEYVESGIMSEEVSEFLSEAFLSHKTCIVSGGTGSGKTSLSNALLETLKGSSERIYIIEDTPELVCEAENHVSVMIQENFSYREAVKSSLRHRPDRIIVGEVRDSAALDLLKAWNTGHPGGLATVHANSARSVHERLIQLVEESGQKCSLALIEEAVDYVIHIEKDVKQKGGRRIKEIIEYVGINEKTKNIKIQGIYEEEK